MKMWKFYRDGQMDGWTDRSQTTGDQKSYFNFRSGELKRATLMWHNTLVVFLKGRHIFKGSHILQDSASSVLIIEVKIIFVQANSNFLLEISNLIRISLP